MAQRRYYSYSRRPTDREQLQADPGVAGSDLECWAPQRQGLFLSLSAIGIVQEYCDETEHRGILKVAAVVGKVKSRRSRLPLDSAFSPQQLRIAASCIACMIGVY